VTGWYLDPTNPRRQTIHHFLRELLRLSDLQGLEFIVSDGQDPLDHLPQNFTYRDQTLAQLSDYLTKPWARQQVYRFVGD